MVHSFHIGHSFSDRAVKVYSYADIGEYDDKYDLMSTANGKAKSHIVNQHWYDWVNLSFYSFHVSNAVRF